MTKAKKIYEELKKFEYKEIISLEKVYEPNLIKELQIPTKLTMEPYKCKLKGLFGYEKLKTDYILKNAPNVVIEFKKIGLLRKDGKKKLNECDIKNALSQVIEQAYCGNFKEAILIIFDGGRASGREWCEKEKNFIKMFKCNPFEITLSVIRIRIDKSKKVLEFEII